MDISKTSNMKVVGDLIEKSLKDLKTEEEKSKRREMILNAFRKNGVSGKTAISSELINNASEIDFDKMTISEVKGLRDFFDELIEKESVKEK